MDVAVPIETGMQLSHAGLGVRLDVIAEGAGFTSVSVVDDRDGVAGFRAKLHDLGSGPHFARIRIAPGNPERALPPRDGTFVKNRLRQHLGFAVT